MNLLTEPDCARCHACLPCSAAPVPAYTSAACHPRMQHLFSSLPGTHMPPAREPLCKAPFQAARQSGYLKRSQGSLIGARSAPPNCSSTPSHGLICGGFCCASRVYTRVSGARRCNGALTHKHWGSVGTSGQTTNRQCYIWGARHRQWRSKQGSEQGGSRGFQWRGLAPSAEGPSPGLEAGALRSRRPVRPPGHGR